MHGLFVNKKGKRKSMMRMSTESVDTLLCVFAWFVCALKKMELNKSLVGGC